MIPRAQGAVLVAAAVLLSGCSGTKGDKAGGVTRAAPAVLKLANLDSDPANPDATDFIDAAQKLSGGSIRIEDHHRWRSGAPIGEVERRTIRDVRSGAADLAVIAARAWDLVGVRSFQAYVAPFLVDSYGLQRRVLESRVRERMLAGVRHLGLVGLVLQPGALRYPVGVSKPFRRPSDYVGASVGIRPSGVARATFFALRADPKVFVPGSIRELDAAELDPGTISFNAYQRQSRFLTANVVLWPRAMTIVINRARFEALSPQQQESLRRAGRATLAPALTRLRAEDDALLNTICRRHGFSLVRATTADVEALRRAVQPVYRALARDRLTRTLLSEIRRLRAQEPARPFPLRCTAAGIAPPPDSSALEGVWLKTLAAADLLKVGTAGDEAPTLAGSWRIEFRDGRWTNRHLNAGTVCSGTYVVKGRTIRFRIETARPAQLPYCTPGFGGVVGWSVYRNTLTMVRLPGHPAPPEAIAKPATRVR